MTITTNEPGWTDWLALPFLFLGIKAVLAYAAIAIVLGTWVIKRYKGDIPLTTWQENGRIIALSLLFFAVLSMGIGVGVVGLWRWVKDLLS